MKELIKKITLVQKELKAPKNQFNEFGKYKYRSCEDILEAVKPLLSSNGLSMFINDDIVNIGDRFYVKSSITITDGENEKTVSAFAREEENKNRMDGSQVTGASSSYARKYALNGLFLIDDTKDSDTTNDGKKEEKSQDEIKNELMNIINNAKSLDDLKISSLLDKLTNKAYIELVKQAGAKKKAELEKVVL